MPSPPLPSSSSSTLPASTSSPSSSSSGPRSSNRPAPSTPSRPLPSSSSTAAATGGGGGGVGASSSPAYTTSLRSRHSLYGTEDRVVLDLGASVCRAGFSGEPAPRACVGVRAERVSRTGGGMAARGEEEREGEGWWTLEKGEASEEEWEVREERVKRVLRRVYFENLMIDPKTRKVIVLENPLLPTRVKELIARVLFDNLQVPSLSFASTPLLALMAAGTLTGLVIDVGHLETTVLPIFHSRPLFPSLTTTPRAGARLTRRLRALLLAYGSYAPPPSSLNSLTPPAVGRIPRRALTDELVEQVKDRMCFVGKAVPPAPVGAREASLASGAGMSVEPSDAEGDADPDALLVKHLYERYAASAPSTTSVSFAVPTPSGGAAPASGVGHGWVQVPGWVRERAAEVLFEEGGLEDGSEGEESGLAGVVLDCLLKLPIDLRKPMASSVLVIGGTSMLPGFFPRFKASLLSQLERSHPPSPPPSPPLAPAAPSDPEPMSTDSSPAPAPTSDSSAPSTEHTATVRRRHALAARLHTLRHSPRYAPLVPLAPHLAILNHPSPSPLASSSSLARAREGSAPAFSPALMGWIGGSLAGALKIGGEEISREAWDGMVAPAPVRRVRGGIGEEGALGGEEEGVGEEDGERRERGRGRLPDWTRLA